MKPHKHAELIKAWADGAEIETRFRKDEWYKTINPGFYLSDEYEYRIKPEPKPDFEGYLVQGSSRNVWYEYRVRQRGDNTDLIPQIKLTFDGETGELKSAEVLK